MIEQHFDGRGELGGITLVHSGEHPGGFRESKDRYPSAGFDEDFGGSNLARIVPRDEPDQNVGVNGAHNVPGPYALCPPSFHRQCGVWVPSLETMPDERPRMWIELIAVPRFCRPPGPIPDRKRVV